MFTPIPTQGNSLIVVNDDLHGPKELVLSSGDANDWVTRIIVDNVPRGT